MRSQKPLMTYVLFILIAIGVLTQISAGYRVLLIGVIVFGLVFLLYKFPPDRWRSLGAVKKRPIVRRMHKKAERKFRVIEGRKKDGNDPPRYH
jgi:hypothetical protein